MEGNLCNNDLYLPFNSEEQCNSFLQGVGTHGLNVLISLFQKSYRDLLSKFQKLKIDGEDSNQIFQNEDLRNLNIILDEFLTPFSLEVNKIILQGEGSYWDNLSIVRTVIFILFILVTLIIYLIVFQIVLGIVEKRVE